MYQALLCLSLMAPGGEPCPCAGSSVCVREPVVTKVPHVTYTFKCTEFCLPRPSFLCRNCDDCKVHHKRELVKKVCIEEKCEEKCVLKPGCCEAPCTTVPVPVKP